MLVEKGFFLKNMGDKTSHDIIVKWNELIKLLKIEKDESQKDFQKGSNHAFTNFKGSNGPRLTKTKKEKTKAEKKEKILTKLVIGKEDKGFDTTKC
jgi:hypothetical protein